MIHFVKPEGIFGKSLLPCVLPIALVCVHFTRDGADLIKVMGLMLG